MENKNIMNQNQHEEKERLTVLGIGDMIKTLDHKLHLFPENEKNMVARTLEIKNIPADVQKRVETILDQKMDAFSKTIYQDLERDMDKLTQKLKSAVSLSESLNSAFWKKMLIAIILSSVLSGICFFSGFMFLMMK